MKNILKIHTFDIPNTLTFVRILLTPVIFFLYIQQDMILQSIAIGLFIIAMITDFFDGHIARQHGKESLFGKYMDPFADKCLTISGFACIYFIGNYIAFWGIILIVLRDVIIMILRYVGYKMDYKVNTRYSSKVKTVFQMCFIILVLLMGMLLNSELSIKYWVEWLFTNYIITYIFYFIVCFTLYTAIEYMYSNLSLLKMIITTRKNKGI